MEVIRQIGDWELLIETAEAHSISFPEGSVPEAAYDAEGQPTLGRRQVLQLLSNGDSYRPLSLTWELLDRCNLTCPFCYIVGHSKNKIIRFPEIRSHLLDLISEGLLYCTLTGGEATIHPDFPEIYSFLKTHGVLVRVFSNGLSISEDLLNLWKQLPPFEVEISIYTLEDQKFHNLYKARKKQAAVAVLENILKIKNAGIRTVCKTFVNTVTEPDAASITKWCQDNEIEYYQSSDITQAYDGQDLSAFSVKKASSPAANKNFVCFPCGAKNYGAAISSAFEIYPCPAIHLRDCRFNLCNPGVGEALKSLKSFMRRFQDSPITGDPQGKCATCIAYAKPVRNETGEILHFSHP